eukprot:TRINITY_DN68559_c0_g1_i1.p1 TRINITY_DN68559_c0_g1~~TRINITY_DN68559_c0_g1_i1.p1  ORF type:complete len:172 (-),score=79.68 TRINITY_DN68559_c0_g1_i1:50-565(-)
MAKKSSGSPGVFSKRGVSAPSSSTSHTSKPTSKPTQPSAASSTSAKPTTPAPTQSQATQPVKPTQQATPGAPVGQTGGRSLLGDIATSAAGSMVGVMGAHAIMGMFGGSSNNGAQPTEAQMNQAVQAAQKCSPQVTGFFKCLENNSSNISSCQWAYDLVKQCQTEETNSWQ